MGYRPLAISLQLAEGMAVSIDLPTYRLLTDAQRGLADALIVSSSVPLAARTLIRFGGAGGAVEGSAPRPGEVGEMAGITPPTRTPGAAPGIAPIGAPGSAAPRAPARPPARPATAKSATPKPASPPPARSEATVPF